jgi:hypothetical protein
MSLSPTLAMKIELMITRKTSGSPSKPPKMALLSSPALIPKFYRLFSTTHYHYSMLSCFRQPNWLLANISIELDELLE